MFKIPKIQQINILYSDDEDINPNTKPKILDVEFVIDDETFQLDDFEKDTSMRNHLQNIVNVLKSW